MSQHFLYILQAQDGLLVWQKRGMRDKVPAYLTFGLCIGMTAYVLSTFWKMAWPQKTD